MNIQEEMPYTILSYNNSFHFTTKKKLIEVLNGHMESHVPFDILINQTLVGFFSNFKNLGKVI